MNRLIGNKGWDLYRVLTASKNQNSYLRSLFWDYTDNVVHLYVN